MAHLSQHHRGARPGVVLLIVMAMLALFAVVGLSFVFYSQSEQEIARFNRQGENFDLADALPEKLMSYALGQLIFDTNDPRSALRGHSLGRSIYGSPGGTVPFNGLGRPHPDTATKLTALVVPFDGINVPYTYPDINNPFLATIDANGVFQERSFFRNKSSLRPATLPATNQFNKDEGDVRNVESSGGVKGGMFNDAVWVDLNYPIQSPRDGTLIKPLFAFTVLDLDGRVNLAIVGNFLADYNTPGVTSRCGLGTFEINPHKVLPLGSEISRLFRGSAAPPSRFGSGANDGPDQAALLSFPPTRFYSRIDYSGTSSGQPAQPTAQYSQFPVYNGWNDPAIGAPHPAAFDYWNSARMPVNATDDYRLAASNAEAILRWRDRGSPALTSDLFRLLNSNLNLQRGGAAQLLNLITPYSMSLDTAHLAPFVIRNGNNKYELTRDQAANLDAPYPKATSLTQSVTAQAAAAGAGDDFTADLRSRAAAELRRINLNRGMFNNPGVQPGRYLQERALMAKDIFDRLVRVTGALPPGPNAPFQPVNVNNTQYKATRWLAQLAVNMVDFMDEDDDNMTVFNWNPKPNNPGSLEEGDFVVGIELNRLLINEVYASLDNDANDPGLVNIATPNAGKYRINVWAELHNPMSNSLSNAGQATLVAPNNQPRYRLLLAKTPAGIADSTTGMPTTLHYAGGNDPTLGVDDWPNANPKNAVRPGDQSPGGAGFYLVAPPDDTMLAECKPSWAATVRWDHTSSGMSSQQYDLPPNDAVPDDKVTVVLQRVADPSRDAQPDPKQPNYNPFITVDYFPDIVPKNGLKYMGMMTNMNMPKLGSLSSKGRMQPLQATQPRDQTPTRSIDKMGMEPQHTFGLQNSPAKNPFNAYYHLDRNLISSAEILMTPVMAPAQFTQRFAAGTPNAPFVLYDTCKDPYSLLYRFLETVTVGDRMYNKHLADFNAGGGGVPPPGAPAGRPYAGSGRQAIFVPGKINLNTAADKRVIEALLDRQSNSAFRDTDVDAFWNDLQTTRSSRPIAGFSDYTVTDAGGGNQNVTIMNTLFQDQKLFQKLYQSSTGVSEYEKTDALRKVMNNITFTSNAFAVWVTVGFFEVDASGNVVQEIGKYENRNVRHRMFAIVDRSQLVIPDNLLTELTTPIAPGATAFTVKATSGTLSQPNSQVKVTFPNWALKPGMLLTIDKNPANPSNEETVMVKSVSGNSVQVYDGFRLNHAAAAPVDIGGIRGPQVPLNNGNYTFVLGYPGPQPAFNLREQAYVVPYYSIID